MTSHSDHVGSLAEALASLVRGGCTAAIAATLRRVAEELDPPQQELTAIVGPKPEVAHTISPERDVFNYWVERTGKKSAKFLDKRRAMIRLRLSEGYSVADLKKAVDGCVASPFHAGQNEDGRQYLDLELIMRTGGNVERFQSYVGSPAKLAADPEMAALEQW